MPRVKVGWRSASKENYLDFCKKNKDIKLSFIEWKQIVYSFNEEFRREILETGEKLRLPMGLGEFTIHKKKRKTYKEYDGVKKINLPIDWQKTREKGKIIYNFNYHTEGYFFGWLWFRNTARFKQNNMWNFKPSRVTSRLITTYLNTDKKYQNLYQEWAKIL